MNKIYKLVWNQVRGCYVVASEFAKSNSRTVGKAVFGAVAAAGMLAGANSVYAEGSVADGSEGAIIRGYNVTASGEYATAWGTAKEASGTYATAWGTAKEASGTYATAWGVAATAQGWTSTAWGSYSKALEFASTAWGGAHAAGQYSTAWGLFARAYGEYSTAFGDAQAYGQYSTAFGAGYGLGDHGVFVFQSKAYGKNSLAALGGVTGKAETPDTDYGEGSMAIGKGALALENDTFAIGAGAQATAANTLAFGNNAIASHANSVALGACSVTDRENSIAVGNRVITGVAAGTADTDAVNVAQLKAAVGAGNEITDDSVGSTALGWANSVIGNRSTAVGFGNIVIGSGSGAFGDPNVVIGDGSYAFGNDNFIRGNNSFAIGDNIKIEANNSVALGKGSAATEDNVVSVGRPGAERKIVNVAPGTADTDAVNVRQLKEYSGRAGANAAALAALKFQPMAKGESQVAVGVGGYLGKKATAIGFAYQINDRVNGSVSGTINGKEHMYNLGFSYVFGQHSHKDVAQTVVPGSMTLKEAELQAVVDSQNVKIKNLEADNAAIKADNAAMKARLDKSDAEIAELKAMVLALAKK